MEIVKRSDITALLEFVQHDFVVVALYLDTGDGSAIGQCFRFKIHIFGQGDILKFRLELLFHVRIVRLLWQYLFCFLTFPIQIAAIVQFPEHFVPRRHGILVCILSGITVKHFGSGRRGNIACINFEYGVPTAF